MSVAMVTMISRGFRWVIILPALCFASLSTTPVWGQAAAESELRLVGEWREYYGGSAYGVVVVNNLAYSAAGNGGLLIVDVSDPVRPQTVSSTPVGDLALDLKIDGNLAFIAAGSSGLKVLDVTDPSNPEIIGALDTSGTAWDVAVEDGFAYLAASDAGLKVINISNPSEPVEVASYKTGGSAGGVTVDGSRLYLSDGGAGLRIFDITDRSNPSVLGTYAPGGWADDVVLAGNGMIFAVFTRHGVVQLDVTDPTNPVPVNSGNLGQPMTATLRGDMLFVAEHFGLFVYDLSNEQWWREEPAIFRSSPNVRDVAVEGDYAYLASTEGGLQVLDLKDFPELTRVGWLPTSEPSRDIVLQGSVGWVVSDWGGVVALDLSNVSAPSLIGRFLPGTASRVNAVAYTGSIGCVAIDNHGLVFVDVSNPLDPLLIHHVDDVRVTAVAAEGGLAILAFESLSGAINRGVRIYDVSNPSDIVKVSEWSGGSAVKAIAISGGRAYVGQSTAGVQPVDITDPAEPKMLEIIDPPGPLYSLEIAQGLLFVAAGPSGLHIIDPVDGKIQNTIAAGQVINLAILDGKAYLATWDKGLVVWDVMDPMQTRQLDQIEISPYPSGVAVDDRAVYVATRSDGVKVFARSTTPPPLSIRILAAEDQVSRIVEITGAEGSSLPLEMAASLRIEESSNLIQWQELSWEGEWSNGAVQFQEIQGDEAQRFYRAVSK